MAAPIDPQAGLVILAWFRSASFARILHEHRRGPPQARQPAAGIFDWRIATEVAMPFVRA